MRRRHKTADNRLLHALFLRTPGLPAIDMDGGRWPCQRRRFQQPEHRFPRGDRAHGCTRVAAGAADRRHGRPVRGQRRPVCAGGRFRRPDLRRHALRHAWRHHRARAGRPLARRCSPRSRHLVGQAAGRCRATRMRLGAGRKDAGRHAARAVGPAGSPRAGAPHPGSRPCALAETHRHLRPCEPGPGVAGHRCVVGRAWQQCGKALHRLAGRRSEPHPPVGRWRKRLASGCRRCTGGRRRPRRRGIHRARGFPADRRCARRGAGAVRAAGRPLGLPLRGGRLRAARARW